MDPKLILGNLSEALSHILDVPDKDQNAAIRVAHKYSAIDKTTRLTWKGNGVPYASLSFSTLYYNSEQVDKHPNHRPCAAKRIQLTQPLTHYYHKTNLQTLCRREEA
jgi:hypothetical protein